MKKLIIVVPGKLHLDNYRNQVQSQFPSGSFILDKKLTGCGATTMFLKDSYYTILCSPRLELMHCKANDEDFDGLLHEFRKADDRTTSVYDLQNQMMDYIRMMELRFQNPFTEEKNQKYPKILVSYDSFQHVAQRLSQEGILGKFRIVVDEFQTLYTDSEFKGDVEISFLHNLSYSNQIIFLSATPYLEKYLDQMAEFQNLPLVVLEWPKDAFHTANVQTLPYYRQSIRRTAARIIDRFKIEHCFERKIVDGREYEATEAVFFLNDIKQIAGIIRDNELTPDNTNIICARTDENYIRLAKIEDHDGNRLGFTVGHAPKRGEQHKPYTFVTRCSFEGTDFYSPCAYTYIFSDINLKHLSLDIWLDVPQIMGRQRLKSNPFRYDATFFYKVLADSPEMTEQDFQVQMGNKIAVTNEWIDTYKKSSPRLQDDMAKKLRKVQKIDKCADDFVAVIDDKISGTREVRFNELAMYNEIRAWEIRKNQYINSCQVMTLIDDTTNSVADDPDVKTFLSLFPNDFVGRMRLYCETVAAIPGIKEKLDFLPQIPIEIKRYYDSLGPDVLKRCSYMEARIQKIVNTSGKYDKLREATLAVFLPGQFWSLKEIKSRLSEIYMKIGIEKTSKASDLLGMEWLKVRSAQERINGQKVNGYRIL